MARFYREVVGLLYESWLRRRGRGWCRMGWLRLDDRRRRGGRHAARSRRWRGWCWTRRSGRLSFRLGRGRWGCTRRIRAVRQRDTYVYKVEFPAGVGLDVSGLALGVPGVLGGLGGVVAWRPGQTRCCRCPRWAW